MLSGIPANNICVNSYPRSGNTYLHFAIVRFMLNNNMNYLHVTPFMHDHCMIMDDSIRQVSIIRNPVDAVTSFLTISLSLKEQTDEELVKLSNDFLQMYTDFLNNLFIAKHVGIIFFEDLISQDINNIILNIFKYFSIEIPEKINHLSKEDLDFNIAFNKIGHSLNLYRMNYPRDYSLISEREKIKNIVEKSTNYNKSQETYVKASAYFKSSKNLITGEI